MASPGDAAATKRPRRKRQILTAEDRERNKRKAEDSKWGAAKTHNAKAWINPTRLLKEVFAGDEDVLVLKVGQATRREICFRSESMNLHTEQLNTQSGSDEAPECWVVVGRDRMIVAENVREIQRQSHRAAQLARNQEEEAHDDSNDLEDHGSVKDDGEELNHEQNLDPRLGENYGQQEPDAKPAAPDDYTVDAKPAVQAATTQESVPGSADDDNDHDDAKETDQGNASKQYDETYEDKASGVPDAKPTSHHQDEPAKDDQHTLTEADGKPEHASADIDRTYQDGADKAEQAHNNPPEADEDRTADWVTQHAAPYRSPSPESLNPTGKWHITSEGITEKYGEVTDLQLSIYITPTRPQSDNDTDDGLSDPTEAQNTADDDVDDADMTSEQLRRKGTYQMWATFTFGLYHGIMRFFPSTAVATPHKRSIFDLQSHQLPSVANTTFQYKWRGRDTTDEEINTEADTATQWVKFEDDGIALTGVFESDVLGENRFEGRKIGVSEGPGGKLGRLWSQVSAQAHEAERKMGR